MLLYMTLLPLAQALFLPTSFWALMWKLDERKHLLGTPGRWRVCPGVCPLQLGRHSFAHAVIQQPLHVLPVLTRPCTRPWVYRGHDMWNLPTWRWARLGRLRAKGHRVWTQKAWVRAPGQPPLGRPLHVPKPSFFSCMKVGNWPT